MGDGGRDEPDPRDYVYEDLFWDTSPTKKVVFPRDVLIVQDQSKDTRTRMACSRFAWIHIHNAQQIIEHWPAYEQESAQEFRLEYLRDTPKAEKQWATLQSVLNQLKKTGRIEWFVKCSTIEEEERCMDRWWFIITGALYGDWAYVRDYHIFRNRTDGLSAWHLFAKVSYDKNNHIALNSFWSNNGYFFIPKTLNDTLYTRYAIIDKDETWSLQAHKDKLLLEEAKRLWIWNGNNPKMNISREDTVLMLMRSRNVA